MVETRVDITEALDGGFGNVIVDIEPTVRRATNTTARGSFTWLQATQIGLDAFVDNTELVGFATELKTGKPLGGRRAFDLSKRQGTVSGQHRRGQDARDIDAGVELVDELGQPQRGRDRDRSMQTARRSRPRPFRKRRANRTGDRRHSAPARCPMSRAERARTC